MDHLLSREICLSLKFKVQSRKYLYFLLSTFYFLLKTVDVSVIIDYVDITYGI